MRSSNLQVRMVEIARSQPQATSQLTSRRQNLELDRFTRSIWYHFKAHLGRLHYN